MLVVSEIVMNWARCFSKRIILVVQDLINKFPLLPMNGR